MQKNFDGWNEEKKRIHDKNDNKLYHERQVWWCSLGINVGFEQDGTGAEGERPVLILKGMSRNTCLVAPLTSSPKKHSMRMPVGIIDGRNASVLLSQIRVVDTKRFTNKIGFIDQELFAKIRKVVKALL